LALGTEVAIDGRPFRITAVRTWQGLLPISGGAPMASLTLLVKDGEPIENMPLRVGQRLDVGADLSLELRYCADRADALSQVAAEPIGTREGRWGVADANGVIWFEGFSPGAGARLMDGSLVTLESFEPDGPAITVRKRTANGEELLRQDGPSTDPPLLLEYGDANSHRLALYVIEDNRVLISAIGADGNPVELAAGETWATPAARCLLRLEQALLAAAPVDSMDSPFFEVVLESAEARVRVRQGEAVRVGDALLRYLRAPSNESAAFRLLIDAPPHDAVEVDLSPRGEHEFAWNGGDWIVRHSGISPGETVEIQRLNSGRTLLIIAASCIVAAVALIWVTRRRAVN
jgi:hypothetical protein